MSLPRRTLLPVVLLLLAARPAASQSPPPIDELMRRLAGVEASRASFVEEKTVAALNGPVRSEGWLVYRRPGFFEKTTTKPINESLMVDGDRLSVIPPGGQPQLIDLGAEPALAALVDAVRGTLRGDLPVLRRSYAVAMEGSLDGWRLVLTPSAPPLTELLRVVAIDGTGTALRSVETVQANGDRSTMTIGPPADGSPTDGPR